LVYRPQGLDPRSALAINLELSHGRHGASARVELHESREGALACVTVRGWIERVALARLLVTLGDLRARRVSRLILDCSQLRHIEYSLVPALIHSLEDGESRPGAYCVCGLSRHLRDLFRLAGCEPSRHCWPSADELLASWREPEPSREWAS
jgi:anti-anti-sigma regulatory factor